MNAPQSEARTVPPHPSKFRRLKQSLVMLTFFMLLLIGLHLWWSWYADRRLTAAISAIRARGGPTQALELRGDAIPVSENAAIFYQKAAGLISDPNAINGLSISQWALSPSLRLLPPLEDVVNAEQPAIAAARIAMNFPKSEWMTDTDSEPPNAASKLYGTVSRLQSLLMADAYFQHSNGDDRGAISTLANLHHLLNSLQFGTQFVQHDEDDWNSEIILAFSPDLMIDDASHSPSSKGTSRRQISQLIHDLLDDGSIQARFERIWYERSVAPLPMTGKFVLAPHAFQFDGELPALQLARAKQLESVVRVGDAFLETNYQKMLANLRQHRSSNPAYDAGPGEYVYEQIATRHAAAIALAIRLYRLDHGGSWPARLAELVPVYLPAVPTDSFSMTNAPLIYIPDAPGGAIVYSVGYDGVDDEGSEKVRAPAAFLRINASVSSSYDAAQVFQTRDGVFHLTPQTSDYPKYMPFGIGISQATPAGAAPAMVPAGAGHPGAFIPANSSQLSKHTSTRPATQPQ